MSFSTAEKIEILKTTEVLGALGEQALGDLAGFLHTRKYGAGDTVFRRGEPGRSLMVVVQGRIKITNFSSEGKELLLNQMARGEVLGEIALLDGEPRSANAVAVEGAEVLVLDRREFIDYLERSSTVATELIRLLCKRLRRATSLAEDAVFQDLPRRLLRRIKAWADAYGDEGPDGLVVNHGLTQREIGEAIGMTRESVNKQLGEWRSHGLLRIENRRFVLPSLSALEDYVDRVAD